MLRATGQELCQHGHTAVINLIKIVLEILLPTNVQSHKLNVDIKLCDSVHNHAEYAFFIIISRAGSDKHHERCCNIAILPLSMQYGHAATH